MRIVDAKTGEWFDEESEGPYMDYMDNSYNLEHGLEDISYDRIDDDWDEENEEYVKRRYEAMIKMREEGLPRINLDHRVIAVLGRRLWKSMCISNPIATRLQLPKSHFENRRANHVYTTTTTAETCVRSQRAAILHLAVISSAHSISASTVPHLSHLLLQLHFFNSRLSH
jgi:hypothetical protein